jgi:transposase-like protein
MVRPGRERLNGRVEVDEAFIGGVEEGVRGRQTEKKALIAVAAEENGEGIGRIRMRRIPDATADSLQAFVQEAVAPGSRLHTDGLLSYDRLEKHGYRAPHHVSEGPEGVRLGAAAPRASRRLAPETVAARDASGRGVAGPPGLLPG